MATHSSSLAWRTPWTIVLISHASKVMLKIYKLGFSSEPRTSRCTSWVLKRQRNQRSNCQHSIDSRESKRIPEKKKKSTSASLIMLKPLTMWITTNCGNSSRDGNTRPPYLPPEKSVCRTRSNS